MEIQLRQHASHHCRWAGSFGAAAVPIVIVLLLAVSTTQPAWAQTFSVLHSFDGEAGGEYPYAGVTIGPGGSLYGTTTNSLGGNGAGVVYELQHRAGSYVFQVIYTFQSYDAGRPWAGVVFGPQDALFGAGYATVYSLRRPPTAVCSSQPCPWNIGLQQGFSGGAGYGDVVFDSAGNLYGTTLDDGTNRDGTVFQMTGSGSHWTVTTLYNFGQGSNDGRGPFGGVVLDAAGNIYGTTAEGGLNNVGTIYKLSPANGGWTETILYNFDLNVSGAAPYDSLAIDSFGNLYGTTVYGGSGGAGTVFELSPSGGSWTFSLLQSFANCTSYAAVTLDGSGNVYGTCSHGGSHGAGMVYKLANSGGAWSLTDLYDFTGGADGEGPEGGVTRDSSGNLFGTAFSGGTGSGTVWEITAPGSQP